MSDFFTWLSNSPTISIIVGVSIGFLSISIAILYIVAFTQGREIDFWPPKIGPKPDDKIKQSDSANLNTHDKKKQAASVDSINTEKSIILIPKANSGYSKALAETIESAIASQLSNVRIKKYSSPKEEHAGEMAALVWDAIDNHPDAILITPPPNNETLVPYIINAIKKGIPVVTIDDQFDDEKFLEGGILPPVNIRCDYAPGGKIAAELILKAIERRGKVAIISGPTTSFSSQIRKLTFIDEVLKAAPNVSIVACMETNWGMYEAEQKMTEIINQNATINAIFCCNDRLAIGALAALKKHAKYANGQNMPVLVGHDGIQDVYPLIISGEILASVDQRIEAQGNLVVNELRTIFSDKNAYLKHHKAKVVVAPSGLTREIILEKEIQA